MTDSVYDSTAEPVGRLPFLHAYTAESGQVTSATSFSLERRELHANAELDRSFFPIPYTALHADERSKCYNLLAGVDHPPQGVSPRTPGQQNSFPSQSPH